jgi:hypothetical protein
VPDAADLADALLSAARGCGKLAVLLAVRGGRLSAADVARATGWGRHPTEVLLSKMVAARLLCWDRGARAARMGPRPRVYWPNDANPTVRLMLAALDFAEEDPDA